MSDQIALDFNRAVSDPRVTATTFVRSRPDLFRRDFADYLRQNWHVYQAFERQANAIWSRGRRRYSARTIIEVLRHESALVESCSEWKLNDWWTKDLARLWVCCHPERAGFFEFRNGQSAVRAA